MLDVQNHFYGVKNGKKYGMKSNTVVKSVKEIKQGNILKNKLSLQEINNIIEMAWCDKTSFDSIKDQTGIAEKDVIKVMRSNLKTTSFKVWRKRVYGRKAKHEKI